MTKHKYNPMPWERVTSYDPKLACLLKAVGKRCTNAQFAQICDYARQQRLNGDPEYADAPTIYTLCRRILRGDYDHLFN